EIMLNTKARAVIFDPNADFIRIKEPEGAELWTAAEYKPLKRRAKLPHERSRAKFATPWKEVSVRVRTRRETKTANGPVAGYEPLQLWWPSLSMAFLAEELDPMLRSDLYHCHAFVKAVGEVMELQRSTTNIIDEVQRLSGLARGMSKENLRIALAGEFD